MKHPRTILATTAIAVLGLVVAAQSFHANIDTAQARPAVIAAPSANPVAWIDPPSRGAPETTGTLAVAPPKPLVVAAIQPVPATAPSEPPRRAVAVRRGKRSARVAHLRRSAPARTAAVDPAVLSRPESRPAQNRIDPIGDILRGLGFGRDS